MISTCADITCVGSAGVAQVDSVYLAQEIAARVPDDDVAELLRVAVMLQELEAC